ncbi:MAG TPA: endonuclease III, partial [Beijerinckiaceae bacterium]|nr:endonuclease III [Beijerinckiaceae bacterium]
MPVRKPPALTSPRPSKTASPKAPARRSNAMTVKAPEPEDRPRPPEAVGPATLAEIFRRFREASPEPKGELEHVDPYTLLVAVVLSAQSTDAGVNKATRELFRAADTPGKMVALGEDRVREHIKTINFLNTKAR